MSMSNYPSVMEEIFKHEGGFVNHPRDPGGATNMGITKRTLEAHRRKPVSVDEVRKLSKNEARQIYRKSYWNPVRGDQLPDGLDLVAMDGGVNSGPSRGIRWLQAGVGSAVDGKIGPKTLAAARQASSSSISKACAARMGFLRSLRHWKTFGKGWTRRVAEVEAVGTSMFLEARHVPAVEVIPILKGKQTKAIAAVKKEKATGGAQAAAGGGTAVGVDQLAAGIPEWAIGASVALLCALAVIAILRSSRRARYQEQLQDALGAVAEHWEGRA